MGKPYLIRISSQKGGVGKTVVAVNFAAALQQMGKSVLLVDADFTNPSIGIDLGLEDIDAGSLEVIRGRIKISEAVVKDRRTGLIILPGRLSSRQVSLNDRDVHIFAESLRSTNFDFVVIDTAPGVISDEAVKSYDEAFILTTPDFPSCTSAMRLAKVYKKFGIKQRLVVNRVQNMSYELTIREIEEIYGSKVFCVLREDSIVPISVSERIAAYAMKKNSRFCRDIRHMALSFSGKERVIEGGFLARIISRFNR